ncbi:hypothetical protein Emag_006927 [Eimeria magna]
MRSKACPILRAHGLIRQPSVLLSPSYHLAARRHQGPPEPKCLDEQLSLGPYADFSNDETCGLFLAPVDRVAEETASDSTSRYGQTTAAAAATVVAAALAVARLYEDPCCIRKETEVQSDLGEVLALRC